MAPLFAPVAKSALRQAAAENSGQAVAPGASRRPLPSRQAPRAEGGGEEQVDESAREHSWHGGRNPGPGPVAPGAKSSLRPPKRTRAETGVSELTELPGDDLLSQTALAGSAGMQPPAASPSHRRDCSMETAHGSLEGMEDDPLVRAVQPIASRLADGMGNLSPGISNASGDPKPAEHRQRRPLPRPKGAQPKAVPSGRHDSNVVDSKGIDLFDLPTDFGFQDVRELCDQYGHVESIKHLQPGRFQTDFSLPAEAAKAVHGLSGLQVPGRAGLQTIRCKLVGSSESLQDLSAAGPSNADLGAEDETAPWHRMRRSHKAAKLGGWSQNDMLQLREEVSARLTEMGNWKPGERTQRKLAKLTEKIVNEVTNQSETDAHDRMSVLYGMLAGALGAERAQGFGIWLS
mmetsp:Transcript_49037/g.117796  ORF Transcript_49037/g.117796 Transcript_49037/m.117796 type:complete len:403 (-) Transcript_49037:22-1230(-)